MKNNTATNRKARVKNQDEKNRQSDEDISTKKKQKQTGKKVHYCDLTGTPI